MADRIRYVPEIGLWAFSRGKSTCRWQTPWCKCNCFNEKFYRLNPKLSEIDKQDDLYWRNMPGVAVARNIVDTIGDARRFRFAVRGEIWTCLHDVTKVSSILARLPDVLFWIPTRAWHDRCMRKEIEFEVLRRSNARVMASIDPSDDEHEVKVLQGMGWSTVFSGDNENSNQTLLVEGGVRSKATANMHRCEKTWDHSSGHCAVCKDGCFSAKRVDVHLKRHR